MMAGSFWVSFRDRYARSRHPFGDPKACDNLVTIFRGNQPNSAVVLAMAVSPCLQHAERILPNNARAAISANGLNCEKIITVAKEG